MYEFHALNIILTLKTYTYAVTLNKIQNQTELKVSITETIYTPHVKSNQIMIILGSLQKKN